MTARVLVVDDDAAVRFTIRGVLEDAGMAVLEAAEGEAALRCLGDHPDIAVVVTDLRMPGMDGMTLLGRIREHAPAPRVVVITAHGDERAAVEAMKAGAWDYFRKPFEIDALLAVVQHAAGALPGPTAVHEGELTLARALVFASPAMARLAVMVERVAPRDVTVLITGESGTGKERVAEAIVAASLRADRPFVRFNAASLGPELAEAELFGHSKGAFTGAARARPGLFRQADGGTLLLDEVGELAPSVQARLLRVLQSGEVRPVGEDQPVQIDVRILAATHRDLPAMVAEGRFREDLYYRLKVVQLSVPPLRERPEDIPLLVRHFFDRFAERFATGPLHIPPGLIDRMVALPWPGNVRELENTAEMLVALSDNGDLDGALLPGQPRDAAPTGLRDRVDAFERTVIVDALRASQGNKSEAARILGIGRVTLYEKLQKLGIPLD